MNNKENIITSFNKRNFIFDNMNSDQPKEGLDGIDFYIRDFIEEINKCEDIMTLYSCEGHKIHDSAYLFFSVNENGWNIFWNSIMPELSERFCYIHPKFPHALYQMEWFPSVTEKGISIHTILVNDSFNKKTGEIIVNWQEQKEFFWNIIKEVFLNNFKKK